MRAMVRLGMAGGKSPMWAQPKSNPRPDGEPSGHQRAELGWRNRRPRGAAKGRSGTRATPPQKHQHQQQQLEDAADLFHDQVMTNLAAAILYLTKGSGFYVGGLITIIITWDFTPIHTPLLSPFPIYLKLCILIILMRVYRVRV